MPNPTSSGEYKVRFIALGGVASVTKNCYVYELYKGEELQDILVVDCGIGFPEATTELGVDFIIPDISYLEDKTDKIRAILLTHGHEDHIGAMGYHYSKLGSPPVYTAKLSAMFVENKFKETNETLNMTIIEPRQEYKFGGFSATFLNMTHSIPDTMHILIKTPIGTLYHGQDFKMDTTPPYGPGPDFYSICKAGEEGILCTMSDALGAFREGLTLSESAIGQTFEDEMRKTKGKFIMTTFSSNISRIRQCVEAAVKFNRKVIFLGRSMKQNTTSAAEIGYLPIPESAVAKDEEIMKLRPNSVCVICAGSQGQYGSALDKLARGKNQFMKIKPGDTVLFSSDPIPGNEQNVWGVIEELTIAGATVVYSDVAEAIHASGHGNIEDLKLLANFTRPKYLLPIGSTLRHHGQYQKIMGEMGYDKSNVLLLTEGDTVWFTKGKAEVGEKLDTRHIYVDALGVGDVGSSVLRDRKTLSSEGMVVAIIMMGRDGKLASSPIILSRGFVFQPGQKDLFDEATRLLQDKLQSSGVAPDTEMTSLKRETFKLLEVFFRDATGRRPLVVVEVIEV